MLKKQSFKTVVVCLTLVFILICLLITIWASRLNNTIRQRLSGKRWSAPTEFYASPERIFIGQFQISKLLTQTLERLEYRLVGSEVALQPGDYTKRSGSSCSAQISDIDEDSSFCWVLRPKPRPDRDGNSPEQIIVVNAAEDTVTQVYEGTPATPLDVIELQPELFGQFYGGQPLLRQIVSLGDVPPQLLNAIMAIEDSDFLTHRGISFTGMLRAVGKNILKGRSAQGGSTITQQLIKNYFLTPEKTITRKFTEILMALLLESQFSKNDILETYVNEVYLGQEVPFQIHGVAAAAKYIFSKRLDDLTLGDCALMAGIIQAPNFHSPFKNPDRAISRRKKVLDRMLELQLISQEDFDSALKEPLPVKKLRVMKDLAPFFIDSIKFQLKKLDIPDTEGLQVFTTLNMRAQQAATEAVVEGLAQLEKSSALLKKEEKYKAKLQSVLIASNPTNGFVEAVVGGRSYGETQLNRTVQSHRQVGSVFKPFVFLTAFANTDDNGNIFTPLTELMDEPFTIKYDRQVWSPQNYDKKYLGKIPLYKALEQSLNTATSQLALKVGLDKVAMTAKELGIDSELPTVPSLALGSATLTPLEVLQAYSTLSRRGEYNPLTFVYKVLSSTREVLYEFHPAREQVADAIETRQTISLMEDVVENGTARFIRASGFKHPAAGKTGTTSDTKDAWFAGFTPFHAAVVWVGFDQPEPTGLTGASGAIPIWLRYMSNYATQFPPIEFAVPEGAVKLEIDPESQAIATERCPHRVSLVFKASHAPSTTCWLHP